MHHIYTINPPRHQPEWANDNEPPVKRRPIGLVHIMVAIVALCVAAKLMGIV